MKLKVAQAEVNRITLKIVGPTGPLVRIFRSERPRGPFLHVGTTDEKEFMDGSALTPGKTYHYLAVGGRVPHLHPERADLRGLPTVKALVPRAPKEKRVIAEKARETFKIRMGGYVDETNAITLGPEVYCPGPNSSMPPYERAFEPNLYVAIENLGDTDVVNPWVVVNGQRDWWSVETMAMEALGDRSLNETEKAMAAWQFVVDEVYDSRCGLSWFDGVSDPVKLLNVYGYEGCVGYGIATMRLAEAMGVKCRTVWIGGILDGHGRGRQCSHTIFEAFSDGAWHLLDTDQMLLFLKRDNRTVACAEDLASDVDLIQRTHRNLGLAGKDMADKAFYGPQLSDGAFIYPPNPAAAWADKEGKIRQETRRFPPPHTMAMRLRPGEKLVRYWDQIGKTVVRGRRLHPEVRYSNGKLVYRPDLKSESALRGVERAEHVQRGSGRAPVIHPDKVGKPARMVWRVATPYAICGAKVGLSYRRESQLDGLEVLLSRDGRTWRSVWLATGNRADYSVDLNWYLNPALNDWRSDRDPGWRAGPAYEYFVQVAMWAGSSVRGVGLDAIRFDTDLHCATRSLPSLFCGENTLAYRDETPGTRQVQITYGWQEEHGIVPPDAPVCLFPEEGADVDGLDFEFRWKKPSGRGARIDDAHIQVSRYADFRWCVCPTFDRYVSRTAYVGRTRWQPQFSGLLNPDERYFWRVRARNSKGVWGAWSPPRSFVPHGPRHPVALGISRGVLRWEPQGKGNPPAAYEVHASVEPGFGVGEETRVTTTEETKCRIEKGRFYRVVSVDRKGVSSTPSEAVAG